MLWNVQTQFPWNWMQLLANLINQYLIHNRTNKTLNAVNENQSAKNFCLQTVEPFQNNIPQRKIVKTLNSSSSTVYNILKTLQASGDISKRKEYGWKSILDTHDGHCIKNRHDSVMGITAWAQEHFQKPLPVHTVHGAIHKES